MSPNPSRRSAAAPRSALALALALSLSACASPEPARAQDGPDGATAPTGAATAEPPRYRVIPTITAIPQPKSFFAIQNVLPSSAVVLIAGDAASERIEVDWYPASPEDAEGPDAGPGVVRGMAKAGASAGAGAGGGARAGAPLGTASATVVSATRTSEARLSPLRPDTRYRYVVRAAGASAPLAEGTFGTPPPGARAITFAAIGDTGELPQEYLGAPSSKAAVVAAILDARPRPELVIHTGDVVYPDGSWTFYRIFFFGPMQPLMRSVPLFPSIGNHDVKADSAATYMDVFSTPANNADRTERYYSFDWGDVHFTALDSASSLMGPDSPQGRWLDADLAASKAMWKIAYFHHPPFSDSAHGDNQATTESFVPTFERRKLDVCITGHDHCYERLRPRNGVLYVVTGGGGARTYDIVPTERLASGRSIHHFVRGRADARRLTLEAIDTSGAVFDAVSLER